MAAAGKQGARALATATVGGVVIAVVVMMVVPLPTWLLDLLITLNLGASVLLLLSAAYAHDALSIATFPTLLLLTTLFRLGLNVSTVRLILLQANAGKVVATFGSFVVGGDYVVGFAVFLILTIVQYVVIARGAERVAEVAARFTLDAMPGKQLAIDADLRSSAISAADARGLRRTLSREAQLYGSLDGAMRFVKGDALAGILILVISLVGGLAMGLRRGLPLDEAARLYTLLTVGDGLASQIPALLVATAAGLVVTRVASEREGEETVLGADIARQFLSRPRMLFVVAGLLGVLALLPGLPPVPFSLVALVFALGALFMARRARQAKNGSAPGSMVESAPLLPAAPPTVALSLAPALFSLPFLGAAVERAGRRVVDDLGLPLGSIVTTAAPALAPAGWALCLRGTVVSSGALSTTGQELDSALVGEALARALRKNAAALIGLNETQQLLDALAARAPALVRDVVPRKVELAVLAEVLRRLLGEGLPIGDLRDILEAIAVLREPEREPAVLVERVRAGLSRRITARHAPALRVGALLLDPLVEEALYASLIPARAEKGTRGTATLALEPDLAHDFLVSLHGALEKTTAPAIVLTSSELRPHVRRLVETDHPDLTVLSFSELLPEVEIETVGRIGL